MGCSHSAEPRGGEPNAGGQQPLQAQTPTFLSRFGFTGRNTARVSTTIGGGFTAIV